MVTVCGKKKGAVLLCRSSNCDSDVRMAEEPRQQRQPLHQLPRQPQSQRKPLHQRQPAERRHVLIRMLFLNTFDRLLFYSSHPRKIFRRFRLNTKATIQRTFESSYFFLHLPSLFLKDQGGPGAPLTSVAQLDVLRSFHPDP